MATSLESYVAQYENASRSAHPAWLARTRDDAFSRFLSLGFPTTRDEEWRFTSVAPIADTQFRRPVGGSLQASALVEPFRLPGVSSAELVFINGHYSPAFSNVGALPRGARVESIASSLTASGAELERSLAHVASFDRHAFTALNTAFLTDGAYIRIPAHTILAEPIHVLFLSTEDPDGLPSIAHPRVLVVMDDHSQASIVESYAGPEGSRYFTNAVAEIALAESAVLDHYNVQREGVQGYHVRALHVQARRNANFTSHSLSLGGSLARNDVFAVLDGEGVECTLNGLYLANDQRLVDNHTTIDHAKPHCGSREVYKGILADRARGVFNGKIIVRPDAQKTDAKQTNRALLLSEDAQINTKPQLEIFANDVRCTHGAAVGQLDDEAVFYLRSRGLSRSEARHMLVRAFAGDVLNRMSLEPLRTRIEEVLLRQLAHVLPAAA
jgi:Fe-S cluster assembly protein SufD